MDGFLPVKALCHAIKQRPNMIKQRWRQNAVFCVMCDEVLRSQAWLVYSYVVLENQSLSPRSPSLY